MTRSENKLTVSGEPHRYIEPRRPQQNGKAELSARIDQENSGAASAWDCGSHARCRGLTSVPTGDHNECRTGVNLDETQQELSPPLTCGGSVA